MNKITCEDCLAWRVCPRKPRREDYSDENKYLIDLESGVWSCKDTVQKVCEENAKLKEQIEKMKSDVRRERSYWNSGETQYHLLQGLLDKWEPANRQGLKMDMAVITLKNVYYCPKCGKELEEKDMCAVAGRERKSCKYCHTDAELIRREMKPRSSHV